MKLLQSLSTQQYRSATTLERLCQYVVIEQDMYGVWDVIDTDDNFMTLEVAFPDDCILEKAEFLAMPVQG